MVCWRGRRSTGADAAAAIEALEAGNAPPTHVILYSPSRLTVSEKVFLHGLRDHDRLSAVLTGSPDDSAGWLHEALAEVTAGPSRPADGDMHLTVAPDAEEEVRLVVRTVLDQLADTACRPERIGIAYRASTPYARLLRELLVAVNARVATSPTALVKAAIEEAAIEEAGEQAAAEAVAALGEAAPKEYPRRGSNQGAAIGTAVHRVLELVDLANPNDDEVTRLAELACAESEIPDLVKNVAGGAGTALRADVVHQAGQSGRAWREVYLIVHDGDRYVEGYIDLLAEPSDGKLVVVDHKTDRVERRRRPGQVPSWSSGRARRCGRRSTNDVLWNGAARSRASAEGLTSR